MKYPYDLRKQAGLVLGLGIALIVLGMLALYFTTYSTLISVKILGWLFIFSGFIQIGHALYARGWSGFLLPLLVGIISIMAGAITLLNPFAGAITLTLLLAIFFIAQGIVRIYLALTKKFEHWAWILVSGILSIILGIMVLYQWPYSGLYIIGIVVGVDLIFNGWALVMLSSFARRAIK